MALPKKSARIVPGLPHLTEKLLEARARGQARKAMKVVDLDAEEAIKKLEAEAPELEEAGRRRQLREIAGRRAMIKELTANLVLRSQSSAKECELAVKDALFWDIPPRDIKRMLLPDLEKAVTKRERIFASLHGADIVGKDWYRTVQLVKALEKEKAELEALAQGKGEEALRVIQTARFWRIPVSKETPIEDLKKEIKGREEIYHSLSLEESSGPWHEIMKRVVEKARAREGAEKQ